MKHDDQKTNSEKIQKQILEIMKHSAKTAQHSQRAFWLPISVTLLIILFFSGLFFIGQVLFF